MANNKFVTEEFVTNYVSNASDALVEGSDRLFSQLKIETLTELDRVIERIDALENRVQNLENIYNE
jgi:polyhydroxyalkanoate synthesis regulator phasin